MAPPAASTSKRPAKPSKFPAARIKKIMQMDEDVGKLASATPVMISKSLECFLQLLMDDLAKEAQSRGSRKVTTHHLKHAINANPNFDFLREIVSTIPDPVAPTESTAGPSKSSNRKTAAAAGGEGGGGGGPKESTGKRKGSSKNAMNTNTNTNTNTNVMMNAVPALTGSAIPPPHRLPDIGTWKKDTSGGGGTGPGGRGMYDDYEEDEDDY